MCILFTALDEQGVVFISEIKRPQSVTLLRTGTDLESECRENSLRVVVPKGVQTSLPDLVKIVF
jgi:hypothetical protein